jgi:hypothetical protein
MRRSQVTVIALTVSLLVANAGWCKSSHDTSEANSSKTNPVSEQPPFKQYMLGGFNEMRESRQFSYSRGFVQQVGTADKGTSLYGRGYLRQPVKFYSALQKQVDGDQPGAISDYLALLEGQDNDPAVHWYLGSAYQAAGKTAEAKQEFEKERLMRKDALRMEREWRESGD